jgi:pimeloyl-ACP methyl ester carboxylesterase
MSSINIFEGNYASVNGVRLHFASAGEASRPLILFLHGFPEFWYAWKRQLAEFGASHFAVAPDMRGYNLSSKPDDVSAYAVKHLVEDVRDLVRELGCSGRFTLVGHDWGGAVAWAFAIAHPALLERLVIINAPHPGVFARELHDNPAQQQASQYMLWFRTPEVETALAADNCALLVRALTETAAPGTFSEVDLDAYRIAWSKPGALTGGLNYYRAARMGPPAPGEPAASFLAAGELRVAVPTLVIWGERDHALLPGNLNGLDAFVPDLRIERIPEGSHWVVHEKPQEVNCLLRLFIAG